MGHLLVLKYRAVVNFIPNTLWSVISLLLLQENNSIGLLPLLRWRLYAFNSSLAIRIIHIVKPPPVHVLRFRCNRNTEAKPILKTILKIWILNNKSKNLFGSLLLSMLPWPFLYTLFFLQLSLTISTGLYDRKICLACPVARESLHSGQGRFKVRPR